MAAQALAQASGRESRQTRRVGGELLQGDVPMLRSPSPIRWQKGHDRLVELHLPATYRDREQQRCEHLRHRADLEQGVASGRHPSAEVKRLAFRVDGRDDEALMARGRAVEHGLAVRRPHPARGPHLAAEDLVRVAGATRGGNPVVDLLPLGVAHEPDHVTRCGLGDERGQAVHLRVVRRHVVDAYSGGTGAHQLVDLLDRAAAQVLHLVRDRDGVGIPGADLAQLVDQLVGTVTDDPQAQDQPGSGASQAAHHLEQRFETGLVVGQVDDDGHRTDRVDVHPAGIVLGVRQEGAQPLEHHVAGDADRERCAGRREGVLHVEAGEPGQRHRHVDQLDERIGVGVRLQHAQPAVDDRRGPDRRG